MLEAAAKARGHGIAWRIDPCVEAADHQVICAENCQGADLCVEFTLPSAAEGNFRKLIQLGIPVVTGTTGWNDQQDEIRELVESAKGSFLFAANFSLGMNLFYRIVEESARIFNHFNEYDPYVFEQHHNGKADSPSGTALQLTDIVLENMERKKRAALDRLQRQIEDDEVSVSAIRAGGAPGSHTVGFDGMFDSITLNHTNRSRESLAQGAILAAEWLLGKSGFFDFNEVIDDKIRSLKTEMEK